MFKSVLILSAILGVAFSSKGHNHDHGHHHHHEEGQADQAAVATTLPGGSFQQVRRAKILSLVFSLILISSRSGRTSVKSFWAIFLPLLRHSGQIFSDTVTSAKKVTLDKKSVTVATAG